MTDSTEDRERRSFFEVTDREKSFFKNIYTRRIQNRSYNILFGSYAQSETQMKNLEEINRNTWRPGASDETSVNSPFSTSRFVTSFPPPIAPFPFWEVVLEKVATTTDEEASLTGNGLSSSKWSKTLQSTTCFVRMHLRYKEDLTDMIKPLQKFLLASQSKMPCNYT